MGDGDRAEDWLEWAAQLHAVTTGSVDWAVVLATLRGLLRADGVRLWVDEGRIRTVNLTVGLSNATHRLPRFIRAGQRQIDLAAVRGQNAFTDADAQLLDRLLRQLTDALNLQDSLSMERRLRSQLQDALQRLPIGAVIVDSELRVRLRTEVTSQIFGTRDGVFMEANPGPGPSNPTLGESTEPVFSERLGVIDDNARANLQNAIQQMVAHRDTAQQMISVPRTVGRPLGLLAARLGPPHPDAAFLILISDPDVPIQLDPDALRRLYRLTPAEARLCAALADDGTLKSYATAEGVSLETVRSQLKQAMVKTGTHKQAQLVRLLVTGPAAYGS